MKKILIVSYFVGMSLVTYLTAKAISTYKSDDIEVKYRKHENELSDTEISQRGITPVDGKNVIEKWETKETRTKTLLGWDTKIETIVQPQTYYVDCGCGK
jgi:transcription antitermination factor NusA-like protein